MDEIKPDTPPPAPVASPPPSAIQDGFKFNMPTIIALLYCASLLVGLTAIIGLVLAYVQRDEFKGSWAESHFTYHIRTFWLGLAAGAVCILLMVTIILIPVAWLGMVAIAVWALIRSIKSLLAAQKEQPLPDPQTMMF
jgi:uncharacterized membrane protein